MKWNSGGFCQEKIYWKGSASAGSAAGCAGAVASAGAAAGAEGSAAPGGNGASADAGSSSSDDVIDAEFTETK